MKGILELENILKMATSSPLYDIVSSMSTEASNGSSLALRDYHVFVPVIWSVIIIAGSIGNGLVIYTLGKNGEMTPTNCFVINLAIADLTFIVVVVPFTTVGMLLPEWIFGDGMCKIVQYMTYVTLHATCLTLTAMTVDRFYAIVYPVSSMKWRSCRTSSITSICVWTVSFLISTPFAMYSRQEFDNKVQKIYCTEGWPTELAKEGVQIAVIFTSYIIPLTVIVICYYHILRNLWGRNPSTSTVRHDEECNGTTPLSGQSQMRRRKRVTRMVAVIVILFAIFWFPIHLINVCMKFIKGFDTTSPTLYTLKIFAHTLSYANSCVNPVVYAFLNDNFKKAFNKTFPSCWWCLCTRPSNHERYTQVTGMVDQAVQAIPDDDQDNENEAISELIQLNQIRKHSSHKPSFV